MGGSSSLGNTSTSSEGSDLDLTMPTMAVLLQQLAGDQLVLVSDALAPYGLADGQHRWDDRVLLVENGTCRLEDGTLAGVTLPLLEGGPRQSTALLPQNRDERQRTPRDRSRRLPASV